MIDSATDVLLFYLLHIFAWMILGGVSAVISGRGQALKIKSASALGLISFAAQVVIQLLFQ